MTDDFDRWHAMGIEGCIREHDDPRSYTLDDEGVACDCDEGNAALDAEDEKPTDWREMAKDTLAFFEANQPLVDAWNPNAD